VAGNKVDDKADCPCSGERREATPAACYVRVPVERTGFCQRTSFYNLESDWRVPAKGELQACGAAQEFNDLALRRNPRIALAT
jgi:hypothetical protein